MALSTVFVIAIVIGIVALVFSIRTKRVNIGFTLTTALLIVCDGLCIFLLESHSIKGARNVFFAYYLAYSWMFFGTTWTIIKIASVKKPLIFLIPMGIIGLVQSVLIVISFNTPRVINFAKQILFGRIWWVVEVVKESPASWSFRIYNDICILSSALVVVVCIICAIGTRRMFRGKMIVMIIFQALLFSLSSLEAIFTWPFWIYTLVMNPVCYIVYYFAFVYSDRKIRDVAIMSFANEMSDGLILYNEYNDLIHVNDLVKNTMDPGFLEKIKDIRFLEDWIKNEEYVENIKTLPYKKGDEEIYFIVRKHDLGAESNPVGMAYILHDTTNSILQIRLMEKVNSELERTSRMKSDFLANMSHELRTPMNAVIGMAEIALREGDMSPRIKDCLNQISHSGKNLLNIINDILDYSKIEAGKMEIIPEKYEPMSEINDISNILQTRIGDKEVELFFLVDASLPHELIGDNMRIRQVLINIANNAIKFTEKGKIRITLDCEWINEEEVLLTYHVKDTGQGIKEEDLEKLFVSFQQVDSKRNRNVEGTGLGLAISKSLCEAMGGTIGVSSVYGKGSDFWFTVVQKVSKKDPDLVVQNAEGKFAYGFNERQLMVEEFFTEMEKLHIENKLISDFNQYKPTGKQDFIFIEENYYTRETEEFLDNNPELTAIVLTHFGSGFKPTRKNVRLLRRPMSTLAMVLVLNGQDICDVCAYAEDDKNPHFIAPGAKVLIVDDNSINLSIAVGLIEPLKISCDVAQSGAEAVEKIKETKYDIILMDHMMPGMDGIETTELIRKTIPEADDTPILALTANVMEGSKELFLNAGMVDMIAKPIDVKQLTHKIHDWLPEEKIEIAPVDDPIYNKPEKDNRVTTFDCLDCETAINGLGSASLFEKIVTEYYKRGERIMEEIKEAYAKKDWPDYAIKTHALKSSSRQIGAMKLGEYAEKLEHAGKAEDLAVIEEVHDTAMECYRELLTNLSKYFPEEVKHQDLPLILGDEIKVIFDVLLQACEDLEMDEMENCAERLKQYSFPDDKKDLIERLYDAIDNVDSEGCEEIIKEYMEG